MITTYIPKHTLISYNRNKHGDPTGVLVAMPWDDNGGFTIGYSQCRKTDKFNKDMGLRIAIGRAELFNPLSNNIPHNIRKMLPTFIKRCERYYKVKVLPYSN